MTLEDDIHEGETQTIFTTSLRPDNQPLTSSRGVSNTQSQPSFYPEDMKKWTEKKFKGAQKARSELKKRLLKNGSALIVGTSNQNAKTQHEAKRMFSRGSAPTFSNVDFTYVGDTSKVNHLI